jgi:LmbE family N-acetylglucosaminyl deacetylase
MNVLVLAPHPDDEAIGCGGTICLHVRKGHKVSVAFLTSGELGLKDLPQEEVWAIREAEARAAAEVLGVAETRFLRLPDWTSGDEPQRLNDAISTVLREQRPETVYVPHEGDEHPDHLAAYTSLIDVCKEPSLRPKEIRTYEVWTPLTRHVHVRDITKVASQKIHAIRCYKSQLAGIRYDRAAVGLSAYRGALAGKCRYAEVFGHVDPAASSEAAK